MEKKVYAWNFDTQNMSSFTALYIVNLISYRISTCRISLFQILISFSDVVVSFLPDSCISFSWAFIGSSALLEMSYMWYLRYLRISIIDCKFSQFESRSFFKPCFLSSFFLLPFRRKRRSRIHHVLCSIAWAYRHIRYSLCHLIRLCSSLVPSASLSGREKVVKGREYIRLATRTLDLDFHPIRFINEITVTIQRLHFLVLDHPKIRKEGRKKDGWVHHLVGNDIAILVLLGWKIKHQIACKCYRYLVKRPL